MSRLNYDEDWDSQKAGLAMGRTRSTVLSRPGKAALEQLERALVAMPTKRLIAERLCRAGEVCAIGALVVQKRVDAGEERAAVLEDLEAFEDAEGAGEQHATIYQGENAGLSYTMAWLLAALNDDKEPDRTAEARYDRVLAAVRAGIAGNWRELADTSWIGTTW